MNKVTIILALSGLLSAPIGAMAAHERPNVIMILIDDILNDTDALVPIRNPNYSGDPQLVRTEKGLRKAPKRPRSLRLPEAKIKVAKAGSRRLQLLDQDNHPRQTHALVLEGEQLLFDVTMEKPAAYNPDKDFHESVNLIDTMPEKVIELREGL